MNITTFYPKHPTLSKYIEYYYFLKADAPDFSTTYYSFPNTTIPVSIHKAATCDIKPFFTGVQAVATAPCIALVQRNYQAPLLVNLKGPIDKVTIGFKPGGIHAFLVQPFGEVVTEDSQLFTAWQEAEGWPTFQQAFFGTLHDDTRVALLEDFLLSLYAPLPEQPWLEKALALLSDFSADDAVAAVADTLQQSPRHFNRLFNKHLSISPVGWKKIARFRHSLHNKLFNARFTKLTEIGYASNFYDQAYFIKVYNKMTGSHPSAFFQSIDKLADDQLIFRFVKE